MNNLVIWNGSQWRLDRLPDGVDPSECVPLDEWLAANRVTARPAVDQAPTPASKSKGKGRGLSVDAAAVALADDVGSGDDGEVA